MPTKPDGPLKVDLVKEMRVMHLVSAALDKLSQGKEESEIAAAMNELKERFRNCERILNTLPAGDLTRADQIELLKTLDQKLTRTRDLVQKYQTLEVFTSVQKESGAPMEM